MNRDKISGLSSDQKIEVMHLVSEINKVVEGQDFLNVAGALNIVLNQSYATTLKKIWGGLKEKQDDNVTKLQDVFFDIQRTQHEIMKAEEGFSNE